MNIYESIAETMAQVGAVAKDKGGDGLKYKYRGIDQVMNALHPAMVKNKIFCAPEVLEQIREERISSKNGGLLIYSVCKVKYTFYAEDGSNISATVVGEAMDSGDKATNKAMSAAFKYACFQVFCIPTEEMIDSETESPEPQPKDAQPRPQTTEPQDPKPATEREPASPAHKKAIAKICQNRGIDINELYANWKTGEDRLTQERATQILTALNKGN